MKTNRVILSLICLVIGFLIAFSYQITMKDANREYMTDSEWERNIALRNQLNSLEERNRELQKQLLDKQKAVIDIEKSLAEGEDELKVIAEEAEQLRMVLGKVKVKGEGIQVTLNDGDYIPTEGDYNNFLVHEHHVFRVIHELYIAGAEAISINGQRLNSNSYIVCNGPVITVDGKQFPAPFVISAIGEADTLEKALIIQGGVRDQLVNDNIVFTLEKKTEIIMEPILTTNS